MPLRMLFRTFHPPGKDRRPVIKARLECGATFHQRHVSMLMLSLVGVHAAWSRTFAPAHRARAFVISLEGRDVPQAARVLKRRAAGVHLDPQAVEAATKVLADEIGADFSTRVAARAEAAAVVPEGFSLGAPTEAEALSTEALSAARAAAPQPVAPGQLILVRHGQSQWNLDNRFTGWANVPLSEQGRDEARQAADLLLSEDIEIDVCYTSVLERAADTAAICLDAWEAAGRKRPELLARWRLNERHYGASAPHPRPPAPAPSRLNGRHYGASTLP